MSDKILLGLARFQQMAEEDREASFMYARHGKDGSTPFYVRCPLGAIEDVARGLRAETAVRFLLRRHRIVVGGDEWDLDGDLALWRKARDFAATMESQGLLMAVQRQGELAYNKKTAA